METIIGSPIVRKNTVSGLFDIVRYGDVSQVVVGEFKTIEAVGAWVRNQGGALGAVKNHELLGRYRECSLPYQTNMSF